MQISIIDPVVQLLEASELRVKGRQSSKASNVRKVLFFSANSPLDNSINTSFFLVYRILHVMIVFSIFMLLFTSCGYKHMEFTLQQETIVKKIMEDNNLSSSEILFFNDSLLIFKKIDKINLSALFTVSYPFTKFHYQGPVFDFHPLSTSLKHLKYIKISNTSQNIFDYSCFSNFDGIEYLFLTNVKKEELLSLCELKIPVLVLYGDVKYCFPSDNFYKIVKDARSLAISNVDITGNSMHFELKELSNLRIVGNFQSNFIKLFHMPKLKVLELFNMKIDNNIIMCVLNHYNNISLNIWACEIESLQSLETLNNSKIKFTINESIIKKENSNEFIYSLTNSDEYQQISQ